MKKIFSLCSAIILLFTCVRGYSAAAASDSVKYSKIDYRVFYNASEDVFVCNKKDIGSNPGTMYFMTYTVKSVTNSGATQHGIVGTEDYTRSYPYLNGGYMKYNFSQDLLMEGYTYFIKFTVTEDGYSYKIARAKENESEYVYMPLVYGEKTDKMKYFGIWFGVGKVSAELIKVRCYDSNGNDLGVQSPSEKAAVICEKEIEKNKTIDHRYTITAKDLSNVAVSNLLPIESNKMYMEYTVKKSEGNLYQSGLICSDYPNENYPFGKKGLLQQEALETDGVGSLLTPGAEYVIEFTKGDSAFSGIVQKKFEEKIEYFVFPIKYGTIGGFWFDGMWDKPNAEWEEETLYSLIRKYQPNAMIINNTGLYACGEKGNIEIDSVTFERGTVREINTENSAKYLASEMCQIFGDHWGYAENDLNFKSVASMIEDLASCRRFGANYLLNVGLMGNGELQPIEKAMLDKVGQWARIYKDIIYTARPTKIQIKEKPKDFLMTDGRDYYLFVHDLPVFADENVALKSTHNYNEIFKLEAEIKRVVWVDSGSELSFTQKNGKVNIISEPFHYGNNTVVRVAKIEMYR